MCVFFFSFRVILPLKRPVKLFCYDNCGGSNGWHKSKKAGWNRSSHARHAASDTWEGRSANTDTRLKRIAVSNLAAERRGKRWQRRVSSGADWRKTLRRGREHGSPALPREDAPLGLKTFALHALEDWNVEALMLQLPSVEDDRLHQELKWIFYPLLLRLRLNLLSICLWIACCEIFLVYNIFNKQQL